MFAGEYAGVEPDIMCLGKALTGGYVSFAATLATDAVADAISEGVPGLFMHGPTFMANPLACAAANASLDICVRDGYLKRVLQIEKILKAELESAKEIGGVEDVRVLGAIGVVEMRESVDVEKIQEMFVGRGVWIRPFGRLVYLMPPIVISDEDLRKLSSVLVSVLKEISKNV